MRAARPAAPRSRSASPGSAGRRSPCRGRCRCTRSRSSPGPAAATPRAGARWPAAGRSAPRGPGRPRRLRLPRSRPAAAPPSPGAACPGRARPARPSSVVAAHGVGDVGQVRAREDGTTLVSPVEARTSTVGSTPVASESPWPRAVLELLEQRGDAVVVEPGGRGAEDRHGLPALAEGLAVAHQLAGDVAAGVLGPAALVLVDRDDVGEVEHVDLLQLRRGANSGVITYSETSENGRIAASPCPMPGVSTTTRSKPAAWVAAMTWSRCSGTCAPAVRVASERKKVEPRSPVSRAFIRIRSPSSAPPPRRRDGSTARTAMRSLSSWSSRSRRSSSSVSEDFPDPPVPVMPSTGTCRCAASGVTRSASSGEAPASSTVMAGPGRRGRR